MRDDRTPNLNLPLPYTDNNLGVDVNRLRAALTALDAFAGTGTAAMAAKLATARKINGVAFDGSKNITITATDPDALRGNGTAVAATKLATARKINGVSFDGTADITIADNSKLPSGGTAVAAVKLAVARKINGVSFDGTADITLKDATKLPTTGGTITGTTQSMSPSTGALRVVGGLGVGGNVNVGGQLIASGNVGAFSDARLKRDIEVINGALAKVRELRGVTFTDIATKQRRTGVIAQELQKVLPEAVVKNGEYLAVAYGNIVGLLIEAVKELSAEIEALRPKRGKGGRS